MLSAHQLTKEYSEGGDVFRALDEVSLEIGDNDCVAIVGKSGSGKSTLMHLLACLDSPTSGAVRFNGDDLTLLSASGLNRFRNETFGFIFQQFFLNGRDSVLENVLLPLKIRGVGSNARRRKALEYIDAVGLADKARKSAKDLSGGEKQRVCIARALASEPRIIFADEPTGNLDSATGVLVEDILFGLNRDKGIALVVVTHDEELASRCPRRVELKDGRIISDTAHAAEAQ